MPLTSYEHFAGDDMLTRVVMERMLAGVATRRHARTAEPVGTRVDQEAKSTSRSAISRRFVRQTETALAELMARDLTGRTSRCSCSMASTWPSGACGRAGHHRRRHQGAGRAVGRLHGEQDRGPRAAGRPRRRGLAVDDGLLVVIDGAKALSAAVREVFGAKAAIQRCTLHKRRNLADHLPDKEQAWVDAKLVKAFAHPDPEQGCAMPNTLPRNWIRNIPAPPPACARGWRRCSPSPAWASTAAWPRP